MDVLEKLTILTDSAKYDVACTSSGSERPGDETGLGSTVAAGLCHAFAADGRCISLLKVLLSNCCVYDCKYCVNRVTNDVPRAAFTPRELADLTIGFYRRNYIEGLFLSSAVLRSPDYTMEQMIGVLELLRGEYRFRGYIHAKAIPGADPAQRAAGPCRPEAYRRGAQTGPVFHHLQRLFPWRDCRAGGHRARPARPRRLWRWHGTAEPVCRARRTGAGGTGNAPCVGRAGSM